MEAAARESNDDIRYDTLFNTPLKRLCRSVREHLPPETLNAAAAEMATAVAPFLAEETDISSHA